MGKAAKKSTRRKRVDQPAAKSGGSTEPSADREDIAASVPAPRPPVEPSPRAVAEFARLQLLADIAGRVFKSVSKWLNHKKKHVQVLGWITWLVLLGVPTAVVVVSLIRGELWQAFLFFAVVTGATAAGDLIKRLLSKGK